MERAAAVAASCRRERAAVASHAHDWLLWAVMRSRPGPAAGGGRDLQPMESMNYSWWGCEMQRELPPLVAVH